MSTIKTALCLLTIIVAYGVVGRMDYEDAVMMENAYENKGSMDRSDSACDSSAPASRSVQTRDAEGADETTAVTACAAEYYRGVRHVHRD